MTSPAPTTMAVTESAAAERLGLSRDELKKLRAEHLYETEHWHKKGRDILLTVPGLERLRAVLASLQAAEGQDSGPAKKTAPAPASAAGDGIVTARQAVAQAVDSILERAGAAQQTESALPSVRMTVTRTVKNPHLVMAKHPVDGTECRVWVSANKNFLPGMVLTACHLPESPADLYYLVGRAPRFRGRW